jgi:demethylmenaquinone methyltransferase/2-methoxy-6-polyprenyl-1,4-benzoquinol methylase
MTDVVQAMQAYYARRAASYERVYHKPERQADLRAMEAWLGTRFVGRRVLEIACGTGWWTPHGARAALDWLATDINPETLAIARAKRMPPCVRFAGLDAYTLAGIEGERFDAAFAGCWWSHVPLVRLPAWIETLRSKLEPGAHLVVLDNSFVPDSSTPISRRDADGNTYQQRTLDDGSVHEVLKNFPSPEQAGLLLAKHARALGRRDWTHYWALEVELARAGEDPGR